MYKKWFKRILDIILASFTLIILAPLIIIIVIIIKLTSSGPIIFKQERVGKYQKIFTIFKFRTMINGAQNIGAGINNYKNDPRITKVGSILRVTSLDEIPQLVNILKGDMSLIGPRPLPNECYDNDLLFSYKKKRCLVKPGIYCIVDATTRANTTRIRQFEQDINYSKSITLKLDLWILRNSLKLSLRAKNAYMPEISDLAREKEQEYYMKETD